MDSDIPTPDTPRLTLRIGPERIGFVMPSGGWLDAGSLRAVIDLLRHAPPTAGELELAIAEVEDGLMPVMRQLPSSARLHGETSQLNDIARAAGYTAEAMQSLSTGGVEGLFNRIADIAHGMPAAAAGVPEQLVSGPSFVATLIVLREVLHHGGFAGVTLEAGDGTGTVAAPSARDEASARNTAP